MKLLQSKTFLIFCIICLSTCFLLCGKDENSKDNNEDQQNITGENTHRVVPDSFNEEHSGNSANIDESDNQVNDYIYNPDINLNLPEWTKIAFYLNFSEIINYNIDGINFGYSDFASCVELLGTVDSYLSQADINIVEDIEFLFAGFGNLETNALFENDEIIIYLGLTYDIDKIVTVFESYNEDLSGYSRHLNEEYNVNIVEISYENEIVNILLFENLMIFCNPGYINELFELVSENNHQLPSDSRIRQSMEKMKESYNVMWISMTLTEQLRTSIMANFRMGTMPTMLDLFDILDLLEFGISAGDELKIESDIFTHDEDKAEDIRDTFHQSFIEKQGAITLITGTLPDFTSVADNGNISLGLTFSKLELISMINSGFQFFCTNLYTR